MSMNQGGKNYREIDTYQLIITPDITEKYVQAYWAERLKELTKDYESVLKDIIRGVGTLVKLIEDWAFSTKPSNLIIDNYQQARKYVMDSISTALKLREEMKNIIRLHFPGKTVFTKPVPQFTVPAIEDFPPRIKLQEKLNEIQNKIHSYLLMLNEKLQDLAGIIKEIKAERDALYEKYKAKVLEKIRQYRDAVAKGDKVLAAQRLQELRAIQADYKADLTKIILGYLKKHRETIDDIVMLLGKTRELIQEYLDIVQPNDIKIYKAVLQEFYRAEKSFRKLEEVTG